MEDFNRISYLVKNSAYLRGLLFLPMGMFFSFQLLLTNRVFPMNGDNPLPGLLFFFGVPLLLMGLLQYFYVKSVGSITNFPPKMGGKGAGKVFILFALYFVFVAIGIFFDKLNIFIGLFLAFTALTAPDFKENTKYRKYVWGIAAATLVAAIFPLDQFFTFGRSFEKPLTSAYLAQATFMILTAVCNHFALLKLMRPLRPETIQNSSYNYDTILGDPSNLTILAALANCQNADFVFLQKISQLDEANFNRQVYYMEQAGLLYVFQLPNGIFKNKLAAKISQPGWEIVTRIYNETLSSPLQPQETLAF